MSFDLVGQNFNELIEQHSLHSPSSFENAQLRGFRRLLLAREPLQSVKSI